MEKIELRAKREQIDFDIPLAQLDTEQIKFLFKLWNGWRMKQPGFRFTAEHMLDEEAINRIVAWAVKIAAGSILDIETIERFDPHTQEEYTTADTLVEYYSTKQGPFKSKAKRQEIAA